MQMDQDKPMKTWNKMLLNKIILWSMVIVVETLMKGLMYLFRCGGVGHNVQRCTQPVRARENVENADAPEAESASQDKLKLTQLINPNLLQLHLHRVLFVVAVQD